MNSFTTILNSKCHFDVHLPLNDFFRIRNPKDILRQDWNNNTHRGQFACDLGSEQGCYRTKVGRRKERKSRRKERKEEGRKRRKAKRGGGKEKEHW